MIWNYCNSLDCQSGCCVNKQNGEGPFSFWQISMQKLEICFIFNSKVFFFFPSLASNIFIAWKNLNSLLQCPQGEYVETEAQDFRDMLMVHQARKNRLHSLKSQMEGAGYKIITKHEIYTRFWFGKAKTPHLAFVVLLLFWYLYNVAKSHGILTLMPSPSAFNSDTSTESVGLNVALRSQRTVCSVWEKFMNVIVSSCFLSVTSFRFIAKIPTL